MPIFIPLKDLYIFVSLSNSGASIKVNLLFLNLPLKSETIFMIFESPLKK